MMPSELEYLDSAWLMTVLPHPNAPGIAHVPAHPDHVLIVLARTLLRALSSKRSKCLAHISSVSMVLVNTFLCSDL